MEYLATDFIIQNASFAVVQKIALGNNYTGVAPASGATPFVPVYDSTTGIIMYKDAVNGTVTEGTQGGLFTFRNLEPIEVTQLIADFGADTSWSLSLYTGDGITIPIATDTDRYVHYCPPNRLVLHPGDGLKIETTDATKAMWLRVSLRSEQAVD